MTHQFLIHNTPHIVLIGAGDTGSQMLTGIARMSFALGSLGLPVPTVTVYDPDTVSQANIGRQLFSPSDIGQSKAHVLVNRINAYFGFRWTAKAEKFAKAGHPDNLFVSCVDSRSSRLEIYQGIATRNGYWLDLGNTNHAGQAILGNSDFGCSTWQKRKKFNLLPTVADLFPEILDTSIPDDDGTPSCSLAEALAKQDLVVNQIVATHATELLWQLLRHGEIQHHGFFFDARAFSLQAMPARPESWARLLKQAKRYHKTRMAA